MTLFIHTQASSSLVFALEAKPLVINNETQHIPRLESESRGFKRLKLPKAPGRAQGTICKLHFGSCAQCTGPLVQFAISMGHLACESGQFPVAARRIRFDRHFTMLQLTPQNPKSKTPSILLCSYYIVYTRWWITKSRFYDITNIYNFRGALTTLYTLLCVLLDSTFFSYFFFMDFCERTHFFCLYTYEFFYFRPYVYTCSHFASIEF